MISNKKCLIIVGVLSPPFIILLFMYLMFIHIDTQYTKIINDEVESMTLIQKLTSESINNYFVLRDLISATDAAEKTEMKMMWQNNSKQINMYVDSLSHIYIIKILNKQTLDYLIDARKEYIEKCRTLLKILDNGDVKKSSDYFKNEVEKSFFIYQNYISNFIFIHKAEVTSYNISISKQIKFLDLDSSVLGLPAIYYLTMFYFICIFIYLYFLTKFILGGLQKK
jgi:hypothetical protein